MGKTVHLECRSGISGDMLVGALLALGADAGDLTKALESIPARGFMIKISQVEKHGKNCTDFDVILDRDHENHDHDMEYLHGHPDDAPLAVDDKGIVKLAQNDPAQDASDAEIKTVEPHHHVPGSADVHGHGHAVQKKEHIHRSLSDVMTIINASSASKKAKSIAENIFTVLAQAESEVHDVPLEKVHFHEVGAIDSIVDILAIAVCIDNLDVERVVVTSLSDGSGTVRTQHGILPVPVPAVNNIVLRYDIPLEITDVKGEMVTPTGAAAVAALRTDGQLPGTYRVLKEGFGSGKRNYDAPCYLRAGIIEPDRW